MTARPGWAVVAVTALFFSPVARQKPYVSLSDVMPSLSDTYALVSGCSGTVDRSDPLAVAGAVVMWSSCGSGPPGVLSDHAHQVVTRWAALDRRHPTAAVATLVLVDPRAAPVVVYAVAHWSGDGGGYRVVVTLFPNPLGGWIVDDVSVLSR